MRDIAKHPRPGDELVNIAINDLPVDFNHPALRDHLKDARAAYDWTKRIQGATPDPTQWHGTANAVLATQGSPWLRVMAYKVMPSPDFEAMMASIKPAIDRGARVINISAGLGFQGNNDAFVKMVKDHPRVLFVVAAGNDGVTFDAQNAESLGAFNNVPNLMVVGSSTRDGGISAESARGAPWVTTHRRPQGEGVWVPFFDAAGGHRQSVDAGERHLILRLSAGVELRRQNDAAHVPRASTLCQINTIMQQTVDAVAGMAGYERGWRRVESRRAPCPLQRPSHWCASKAIRSNKRSALSGITQQDAARLAPLMRTMLTQVAQVTPPQQQTPNWTPPTYRQ